MHVKKIALWVAGIFGALVLLFVAIIGGLYLYLRTSLPQLSGTMTMPGISGAIVIARDKAGVPHITAASDDDAMFAIGFVQAQDRIFQMDMLRRFGEGRLSEIAGKETLSRDAFMRTLGIEQAATRQLAQLAPAVRHSLERFAAGVNAYIHSHRGARYPLYYVVPGPENWRPLDTLVVEKLMTLYLTRNLHGEILHGELANRLSVKELRELFPEYPADGLVTLPEARAALNRVPLERLRNAIPAEFGTLNDSNNWVVDGEHSVSGKPILENDPHLTYTSPSIWYLAEVKTPGLWLAGGMIPGMPFIAIGHNGRVGWGMTETGGDVEDVFIEKIDPANRDRYIAPNGTLPFGKRREVIHVRGGKDIVLTVRTTRHGPVISDLAMDGRLATPADGFGQRNPATLVSKDAKNVLPGPGYVLALEATYLSDTDHTPQAFWEMNRAQNWKEFRQALRHFGAPQMNIVYADVTGTVAFMAPALIPVRKRGDGWLPHPGWTGEYDWTGFIPFDALPQSVNPPSGRFVSANNKIVPDSYRYFIARDWGDPYRADRIEEFLGQGAKQSLDSTAEIAGDIQSGMARQLLPLMLRLTVPRRRSAAAYQRLRSWDYEMRTDAPEPLIFAAWLRELNRELFEKRLGDLFPSYWGFNPRPVFNILRGETSWCGARAKFSCAEMLTRALDNATAMLAKDYGTDPGKWRWGTAHRAEFPNPALSRIPLIGSLFDNAVAAPGDDTTVNAGYMDIQSEHPFVDQSGPGLRFILDFSDLSRSRFMFTPGISGNPLSRHYGDLKQSWRSFDWMVLSQARAINTLRLVPQAPPPGAREGGVAAAD